MINGGFACSLTINLSSLLRVDPKPNQNTPFSLSLQSFNIINPAKMDAHRKSVKLNPSPTTGLGVAGGDPRYAGALLNNGQLGRGGGHSASQMNGNDEAYYANATIDLDNSRLSRNLSSLTMHENQLNNNSGGVGAGSAALGLPPSPYYSNVPMPATLNNGQLHSHLLHAPMQISPSSSTSSSLSNCANNSQNTRTEIMSRSQDVIVNEGTSAILSCRLKNYQYSKITWRKSEPETYILRQDEKYDISITPNGEARLIIKHTRLSDSGVYLCCVENNLQSQNSVPYHLQCSIGLVVVPSQNPTILYEPLLNIVDSKTIAIAWNPAATPCYVEYCRIGETEWRRETTTPVLPNYEIRNLKPGDSYTFRLMNPSTGVVGVSSLTLTLPANDSELWQLQHVSGGFLNIPEII